MGAMFDFIIAEMDLLSEICLRIELKKLKIVSDQQTFLVWKFLSFEILNE